MFYQNSEYFPANHATLGRNNDGMAKKEEISNVIPGGKAIWNSFTNEWNDLSLSRTRIQTDTIC